MDNKAGSAAMKPTTNGQDREVYYLANFKAILESCLLPSNPESHVISADETSLIAQFHQLNTSCQQLYVRLFLRKHQWQRAAKLSYKEIALNLDPVLDELCEKGLLCNEKDLQDPSAVLDLLQVQELKRLCQQFHMPSSVVSSSKAKMAEALFRQDRQHQPLFGKKQFMSSVVAKAKAVLGGCVKVAERSADVFSKMMLLFSLTNSWVGRDEENDFSQIIYQMLQVSVGRLLYPKYEIFTTRPLFKDKQAFEKYYQAVKDEQHLSQAATGSHGNIVDMIVKRTRKCLEEALVEDISSLPPFLIPFTCGHVYVRTLSQGVELQEKKADYTRANQILEQLLGQRQYGGGRRKKWWDRLALNYDYHLKDKEKCLNVIHEALEDGCLTPPIRLSLVQRARRILQPKSSKSRKRKRPSVEEDDGRNGSSLELKGTNGLNLDNFLLEDFPEENTIPPPEIAITGKQLHGKVRSFYVAKVSREDSLPSSLSSSSSKALVGVENYAITHYMSTASEVWPCALHAENTTFSMLFALLMWEVLFSRVPDVFRAPFQSAPLDLFSSHFYDSRREAIEARLDWIRSASEEDIAGAIAESWEANCGYVCVGVNWELFPSGAADVKDIALCLGQQVLGHICKVYSKSYTTVCSGLPDLILWNPTSRTYKLVEVKGPGDKLSHKQQVWLTRLQEWGCPVELCHVRAK